MVCLRENVPLGRLTTVGVGGPCPVLIDVPSCQSLPQALSAAEERSLQVVPLGGGSNVVVADRGVEAAVLRLHDATCAVRKHTGGTILLSAGAGAPWDGLVAFAVEEGLAGLEALSGIPGTAGGAVVQNAGAYGSEIAECLHSVEVFDIEAGQFRTVARSELKLGYRKSALKHSAMPRWLLTYVHLQLQKSKEAKVSYEELKRHLGKETGSLGEIRQAVLELRRQKGTLFQAKAGMRGSAGCFFTNPVIPRSTLRELKERFGGLPEVPAYPAGEGKVKLSAASLIEKAGFRRGCHRGHVHISQKHALCFETEDGCTARELVAFAASVQKEVVTQFGVLLSPEPVFLGFRGSELPLQGAAAISGARTSVKS